MSSLGIAAVGRNEGDRLRVCLESIQKQADLIVYVDSGSSDQSVSLARSMGVDVVELDPSIPYTAARARNAGLDRLTELHPDLQYVHFIDADCEVVQGWFDQALEAIETEPDIAAVWGRRRECYPNKSIYNRLCDLEWRYNWPFGYVTMSGGDVLMRVDALQRISGWDARLIIGEDTDVCFRLRQDNWRIFRVDAEMTVHDINMTRFSQWWQRAVRTGHAYAEGVLLHGRSEERYCVSESRSIWFWGVLMPVVALGAAWPTNGFSLILLALYPALSIRIYRTMRNKGLSAGDACVYSYFCILAKFPGAVGQLRFHALRLMRLRSRLIEYK